MRQYPHPSRPGSMQCDVHFISGVIAIVLTAVQAVWATVVLRRRDERWLTKFHRFSVVWAIWLIPSLSPMFVAMASRPR